MDDVRRDVTDAGQCLMDAVSGTLTGAGWRTRPLGPLTGVALTHTAPSGVMATAQLTRMPPRKSPDLPVTVDVHIGVGHEPALDLMPLLGLRPVMTLVDRSHGLTASTHTMDSADDIDTISRAIVTDISDHLAAVAHEFPTPAHVEAALWAESQTATTTKQRLRMVLLATAGEHDATRELLAHRDAAPTEQGERFSRQMTRWLDAGGPPAPPLTDTLTLLPEVPRQLPSLSESFTAGRARSAAVKAAVEATRERSRDADLKQTEEILADEHRRRNLQFSPSDIAFRAEEIHLRHHRLGRIRVTAKGLHMMATVGVDALKLIARPGHRRSPAAIRRPPRATFHVTTTTAPHIGIDLDDDALDWVRGLTHGPRRLGPFTPVDVWLGTSDTDTGPDRLIAHIGSHRVGAIPASAAHLFDRVVYASALFDEDPYLSGRITRTQRTTLLEVASPFTAQDQTSTV